jgi:DNA-binding transcriptional regulator YhcF (GntR family)
MPKRLEIEEAEVLEAISGFQAEAGYAPTVRELAVILDCSKTTVFRRLNELRERGQVRGAQGIARSWGVTPAGMVQLAGKAEMT